MVGAASVIMQYKFQQSFVFYIVPPIQFIDRVLDITVMIDRRFLVHFLAGVAPVVVQRQVPVLFLWKCR